MCQVELLRSFLSLLKLFNEKSSPPVIIRSRLGKCHLLKHHHTPIQTPQLTWWPSRASAGVVDILIRFACDTKYLGSLVHHHQQTPHSPQSSHSSHSPPTHHHHQIVTFTTIHHHHHSLIRHHRHDRQKLTTFCTRPTFSPMVRTSRTQPSTPIKGRLIGAHKQTYENKQNTKNTTNKTRNTHPHIQTHSCTHSPSMVPSHYFSLPTIPNPNFNSK